MPNIIFYESNDHPDLHSFPTRRSSDLEPLERRVFVDVAEAAREHELEHGGVDLVAAVLVRDRKSTRLNSSHSQTSYAVFCLKKKRARPCHLGNDRCVRARATCSPRPRT